MKFKLLEKNLKAWLWPMLRRGKRWWQWEPSRKMIGVSSFLFFLLFFVFYLRCVGVVCLYCAYKLLIYIALMLFDLLANYGLIAVNNSNFRTNDAFFLYNYLWKITVDNKTRNSLITHLRSRCCLNEKYLFK